MWGRRLAGRRRKRPDKPPREGETRDSRDEDERGHVERIEEDRALEAQRDHGHLLCEDRAHLEPRLQDQSADEERVSRYRQGENEARRTSHGDRP